MPKFSTRPFYLANHYRSIIIFPPIDDSRLQVECLKWLRVGSMKEDIYAFLAKRIREERKAAGLTINQLAETAGIGTSFLAYIETNGRKPSVHTIAKIAEALEIPVSRLFTNAPTAHHRETDYHLTKQFTHMLRDKSPREKTTIMKTLKTLSRNLGK